MFVLCVVESVVFGAVSSFFAVVTLQAAATALLLARLAGLAAFDVLAVRCDTIDLAY